MGEEQKLVVNRSKSKQTNDQLTAASAFEFDAGHLLQDLIFHSELNDTHCTKMSQATL